MSYPKANGVLTFFYYKDLAKAGNFYEEIMGFQLVQDQKWAKIFKINDNAYMGCVDGNIGYHKPSEKKPVMLTVIVGDPDAWYVHFKKHGVETLNEPHDDEELNLRIFLLEDPEGYVIEIQKFYKPLP
ncbi:MAG: VOC family protein [Candidatus Bathyarchaeota archaeon]|nr:VOC family protein [Candidatus Bathyarchaeota archaeon]